MLWRYLIIYPHNIWTPFSCIFLTLGKKKRHYKRRFVTHDRMAKVARVLKSGGKFHAATDWEHYAFWMLEVLDGMPEFINSCEKGNFTPRPDFRPLTKFEKRGITHGHGVWDLIYLKA